jgi:hypothetical protein
VARYRRAAMQAVHMPWTECALYRRAATHGCTAVQTPCRRLYPVVYSAGGVLHVLTAMYGSVRFSGCNFSRTWYMAHTGGVHLLTAMYRSTALYGLAVQPSVRLYIRTDVRIVYICLQPCTALYGCTAVHSSVAVQPAVLLYRRLYGGVCSATACHVLCTAPYGYSRT